MAGGILYTVKGWLHNKTILGFPPGLSIGCVHILGFDDVIISDGGQESVCKCLSVFVRG